jgi:RNA polymerase sigma-70 factor (ECF subfamily)
MSRSIRLEDLPEPSVPPAEADDTLINSVLALPMKLRETVLLVYYSNLSAAEAARALSISVPAVYKRLKKAHGILKIELEGWFHEA